jgi:hypothetical protein
MKVEEYKFGKRDSIRERESNQKNLERKSQEKPNKLSRKIRHILKFYVLMKRLINLVFSSNKAR